LIQFKSEVDYIAQFYYTVLANSTVVLEFHDEKFTEKYKVLIGRIVTI